MPKSSKSSAGAPVEPSATPDVQAPASDDAAAVESARREATKTGPKMRDGGDQHRGEPAHPGVPLAPPGIVPESDVRVHTPAAAAPLPAHGLVNEGLGELPWAYGDARLVGLVRDPNTLFIYWDFSPHQIEQAFAGLGRARSAARASEDLSGRAPAERYPGAPPTCAPTMKERANELRRALDRPARASPLRAPPGIPGIPRGGLALRGDHRDVPPAAGGVR